MELLFHETPDYTFLRVFGCACWPNLRPYNNHKLAFRSTQCVFLGYSSMHKGYKCLDRSTGRIYISRDVVFDEHFFPFASAPSAPTNPSSTAIIPDHEPVAYNDHMRHYRLELLASDNPTECSPLPLSGSGPSGGAAAPGVTLHSLDTAPVASVTTDDMPTPASSAVPAGSPASTQPGSVSHPTMGLEPPAQPAEESSVPVSASTTSITEPPATAVTRLWNNITKPRVPTDGTILYNPARRGFFAAPSSYRAALADDQWRAAM
jgi:hypothetical protein